MMNNLATDPAMATDATLEKITRFASGTRYDDLPPEIVHIAKIRIIDCLGALLAGFQGEPCAIARQLAGQFSGTGATIIGTRLQATPDMAAYVNGMTARYAELIDSYHRPGTYYGHPGEVTAPLLSLAQYAHGNGKDIIRSIVIGYEIFLRMSDKFSNRGFDFTNFAAVAIAASGGTLLSLQPREIGHAVSIAATSGLILREVRDGQLSMMKSGATGIAGRTGVFSALLAQAGMTGPQLPFEGRCGWRDHVARGAFELDTMGGKSEPFRILEAQVKVRPSAGNSISSILAAEKIAPIDPGIVDRVTVEVYRAAKNSMGTADHCWNPGSRETADHSIPYVVAAALVDGTVSLSSFDNARLWDPTLRSLMGRIEVVENEEFTQGYERIPQEHRTRVTLHTSDGRVLIGETGGGSDDWAAPRTDAQINEKFLSLTEGVLGVKNSAMVLDLLWKLETLESVEKILELTTLPDTSFS